MRARLAKKVCPVKNLSSLASCERIAMQNKHRAAFSRSSSKKRDSQEIAVASAFLDRCENTVLRRSIRGNKTRAR
jgi:hypothetical protein